MISSGLLHRTFNLFASFVRKTGRKNRGRNGIRGDSLDGVTDTSCEPNRKVGTCREIFVVIKDRVQREMGDLERLRLGWGGAMASSWPPSPFSRRRSWGRGSNGSSLG